jgi:acetolactate decarboxylase
MRITLVGILVLLMSTYVTSAQQKKSDVKIIGQMKNVMWKGELYGNLSLAEINDRQHLYGFGPVEYLAGEILIIDGRSYRSTVLTPTTMKVDETFDTKAPFFAYANINKWSERALPDAVQTLEQLELYLDNETKGRIRPFLFKLSGTVDQATIHIVNLPKGAKVSSPDDAHQGQTDYQLANEVADIVGFFSTEHKAIFTHHNTFLHLHLITSDRTKMGHLDKAVFKKGTMKLYLPAE